MICFPVLLLALAFIAHPLAAMDPPGGSPAAPPTPGAAVDADVETDDMFIARLAEWFRETAPSAPPEPSTIPAKRAPLALLAGTAPRRDAHAGPIRPVPPAGFTIYQDPPEEAEPSLSRAGRAERKRLRALAKAEKDRAWERMLENVRRMR